MGRVMRWACFVFGSVMLLLSGMLVVGRTTEPLTTILVNLQGEPPYSPAWFVPGIKTPRLLHPDLSWIEDITLHADGSVTFISQDSELQSDAARIGAIYRIQSSNPRVKRITHLPTWQRGYTWTSDEEWLVYGDVQLNVQPDLYRIRYDGTELLNLTATLDANVWADSYSPPLISADNEWVIFTAVDTSLSQRNVYRVRLAGGTPEVLTRQFTTTGASAILWPADSEWVLIKYDGEQLAWLKTDGSELVRISSEFTLSSVQLRQWLPQSRLLLVTYEDPTFQVVGIRPGEPIALWEAEFQFGLLWITSDERWIVWGHQDGTWYRMRPDGSEKLQITNLPLEVRGWH
jgi:hypothetical protein